MPRVSYVGKYPNEDYGNSSYKYLHNLWMYHMILNVMTWLNGFFNNTFGFNCHVDRKG